MTALRKILVEEEPVVGATVARAPAVKLYVVSNNAPFEAAVPEAAGGTLKNIALFFTAPFFGLAYIVALPFVGLAVLAVLAGRFAVARYAAVNNAALMLKNAALAFAAPLLGLAYIVFFPVIGLAALAWLGGRAVAGNGRAA
jgi:hypothetical protein